MAYRDLCPVPDHLAAALRQKPLIRAIIKIGREHLQDSTLFVWPVKSGSPTGQARHSAMLKAIHALHECTSAEHRVRAIIHIPILQKRPIASISRKNEIEFRRDCNHFL